MGKPGFHGGKIAICGGMGKERIIKGPPCLGRAFGYMTGLVPRQSY